MCPEILTAPISTTLRPAVTFLLREVHVTGENLPGVLRRRPRLLTKIGFSRRDAKVMFRRFPSLFCYIIEENLEPKFDYFVVEMGREMMELNVFPQYFSFSLEKRIKPRHMMCVEKGVCLSLPVMLKSHESRFRLRLDVCCTSSMPVRQSPFWCVLVIAFDVEVPRIAISS
ncbi:hypothetical protein KY290_009860 [Solanum tuberosum]|uniref:PORR domain-containing protein n=1 Tax=Solanum tuberosum TaxID=4113 RepID=A0ABQ7VY21_SOLTU|nr:hypothetical protein KY289_010241 [Solanum tuberosum]KAH0772723.1 hypothetical protein KY290_009860 [Solanum tuberosum]